LELLYYSLLDTSFELHAQIFVLDHLLGQGIWDGSARIADSDHICQVVEGIQDLIDWTQCGHLRRFMEAHGKRRAARQM
jgi:hypothetical protein